MFFFFLINILKLMMLSFFFLNYIIFHVFLITQSDEALNSLSVLVDKHLVEFTTNLNDSDILMTTVAKKNYVYVRDRPAIEHLVYNDYLVRRKVNPINERSHCPFATATTPFLKRVRAFAYPNSTRWNALFDPQYD